MVAIGVTLKCEAKQTKRTKRKRKRREKKRRDTQRIVIQSPLERRDPVLWDLH